MGIAVFQTSSQALVDRHKDFNTKILRMADLYISNLYKKMTEYTDLVYGNPEVQRILNADWDNLPELEKFRSLKLIEQEFFLPMVRANKEFDSIWVLRENAQSFGSSQFTLRDEPFLPEKLPWFSSLEKQSTQQFYWIPTRPAEFDNFKNPVFSVARWVPNLKLTLTGPRYLGVVVLNMRIEVLEQALNLYSAQTANSSSMFVIDEEGRVVAHPDRDFMGSDWSGTTLFQNILSSGGREGQFVVEGSGSQQELISYVKTENTGWRIVTVTPYEFMLTDVRQLGFVVVIISIITLMIAVIMASLISTKISKPIEAMKNMMAKVEGGDLSARYHTHSEHEIGQLSQSLNRMMDDLEHKTENLLVLDKMKDEFLANTSHELRTPLNGIMGITDFLLDGGAGTLGPVMAKNLSIIMNSSRRLSSLVNDILDFSKLKNQQLQLQIKPVEISSVIMVAMEIIQPMIRHKSLILKTDLPENLPRVLADENRLEQIFLNLLGNSVKFTDEGTISITATQVGAVLEIAVSDTGIGIPMDKLESIFNDFEQVDASSARSYGGTGLGLSITKRFVELHGGKIWCESVENKGSRFLFTIPTTDAPAQESHLQDYPVRAQEIAETPVVGGEIAPVTTESQAPVSVLLPDQSQQSTYRILAVDDEPVNLQVLSNHLTQYHYEVVLTSSGPEALKILEQDTQFDLIILDIMMPRMSGYEVCRMVRDRFNLFEMPILMLTAKNQPGDIIAGFDAGANDYLLKPFDKAELLARTKTMVTLKQMVRAAVTSAESLEVERRQRQLAEVLRHANNRLSATLQTDEVLTALLDSLLGLISYDVGAAYLRDKGELGLVGRPITGVIGHHLMTFPWGEDKIQEIHEKDEGYLYFPRLSESDRDPPVRFSPESQSSLTIPLYFHETLEGVVVLESKKADQFDGRSLSLILTLISQAVISLENARLFEEVKKMADVDALTEINNRRHFLALAERELKLARRNRQVAALMLFDVDHFKTFNDKYGHDVGDLVLKSVAQTAHNLLRDTDILGRFGGEEFVILLPPQSELVNAKMVAERLRVAVESTVVSVPYIGELHVTISIGLVTTEEGLYTLTELIKLADEAMYEAKGAGRNRVSTRNVKELPNS